MRAKLPSGIGNLRAWEVSRIVLRREMESVESVELHTHDIRQRTSAQAVVLAGCIHHPALIHHGEMFIKISCRHCVVCIQQSIGTRRLGLPYATT
jgi:hypothetical protein